MPYGECMMSKEKVNDSKNKGKWTQWSFIETSQKILKSDEGKKITSEKKKIDSYDNMIEAEESVNVNAAQQPLPKP